jgi:hypothetical protein
MNYLPIWLEIPLKILVGLYAILILKLVYDFIHELVDYLKTK